MHKPFEFKSSNITDEYYNNFGDNEQNATNSSDFFDGSNTAPLRGRGIVNKYSY